MAIEILHTGDGEWSLRQARAWVRDARVEGGPRPRDAADMERAAEALGVDTSLEFADLWAALSK